MTAASLSGRDRATCLNHYLPPSECRLFHCLPCLPSHQPRVTRRFRLRCAPSGLWGLTSTVQPAFGNLANFSCAMVVVRKGLTVSKQRLSHWIVDAIKAAYTSQGLNALCTLGATQQGLSPPPGHGQEVCLFRISVWQPAGLLRIPALQAGRSVLSLPSAVGE